MTDDDDEAAHDDNAPDDDGSGGDGMQHQFLHAEERSRAGDTQALAPATEEQAGGLDDKVDLHGEEEKQRQQQEPAPDDQDGNSAAAAPPEDEPMQGVEGEEGDGEGEGEGKQGDPLPGAAPRKWGGGSKAAKAGQRKPSRDDKPAGQQGGEEEEDAAAREQREQEEEAARQQAVLDSLQRQGAREDGLDPMDADGRLPGGAEAGAEDADLISGSVARLALDAEPQPPSTDDLAEAVLPQALEPEQVEELRRQLDERLKTAAAGALDAAASADPSLQRYGAEVWSRCEALTAGLASELTEQLRLILEPTLASKMAGDFKTGVRAMIECGVGFAAAKGA